MPIFCGAAPHSFDLPSYALNWIIAVSMRAVLELQSAYWSLQQWDPSLPPIEKNIHLFCKSIFLYNFTPLYIISPRYLCYNKEMWIQVIPSDWSILTDFVNTRALLTQIRYAIWRRSKTFQRVARCSNLICYRGGYWVLRYCGIELSFMRYFSNWIVNVRYRGISSPGGMRFFILLPDGIR